MDNTKTEKFNQIKYQQEYNKTHYDTLAVMIPKGMKSKIKDYAKSEGLSVAKYVVKAIESYESEKH